MSQPVTIENDWLRMEVWPTIGGKVASVIDKRDKFELMFNYPTEIPTSPQYDESFDEGWHGGWNECFPSIAPSNYVGHPYDRIPVPDHGELWALPTVAVPTKDGITTVWHGLRFGYRLVRKLYLDRSAIVAEYTLVNLAPFDFRFVWAQNALFSMNVPTKLELSGPQAMRYGHDAQGVEHPQDFDWPTFGDLDLSHPEQLPAKRGWKVFTREPIREPIVIRYPTRNRSVSIAYSSEEGLDAYWGIWINTGGWGSNRHFSVEPTTGRFDQIDQAVQDKSAGSVGPMGKREWVVRWEVG
jgi:hypothetical protein